ncbi:MAG: Ca2+/Na+ antiporter [halophilic archaeon J07HB67]|jgi:Ca2+/Na+ antiporter|nr:MAG: Ca2+/Na+ antiporter [halophilic archaeon J07HB67]
MVLGDLVPQTPAVFTVVVVVATGLIWIGSGWLEESAEELSRHYGLPEVIQGSVVVAVGSSSPELASVVFAALAGSFGVGVGAVVGSAVFNVLVVPGLSGVVSDGPLDANRTLVYKEAQFYMLAVSALLVTFALAVIYVPTDTAARLSGEVTRPLAAIPLLLYGLYVFIQWQDVTEYEATDDGGSVAVTREWAKLLAGLATILIAVEQLVGAVGGFVGVFGIPEFLAGATILAAATSLPDALVSVRAASDGRGLTSLGNVLGSNTFDLLVAIPLGVLIVPTGRVPVDFGVAAPMMGVLTLATILLFTVLRTDLTLTAPESYTLLGAYGVFVIWIVAETLGVVELLAT